MWKLRLAALSQARMLDLQVVTGGLVASRGIAVSALGDVDDTMCIVVAHVVVGY